jgi:uncharacterized protein
MHRKGRAMHRILWQRLDRPGHDACRFTPTDTGWCITGAAVYDHDGEASTLAYRLDCDGQWVSERALVTGWIGALPVSILLERQVGDRWQVNGVADDRLTGLKDVDLGFTPASNTNALRRLALAKGERAVTTAVWLDEDDWSLKPLPQIYHRLGDAAYVYASPTHGYSATLGVDAFAAVTDYPGLWSGVSCNGGPAADPGKP